MFELSTREIEKQIAQYRLHFSPVHDDEIEWRYQPPPFVIAFVDYVDKFQRIPGQLEFKDHYFQINRAALRTDQERWGDKATREQKERALVARLLRAYPSFVRDAYLFALLREQDVDAAYDATQDVEGGVDLVATKNKQQIQIHVYLDSPRAKQGRAKKDARHHFAGKHYDLILRQSDCKMVGEFWLPTLEHVRQIASALDAAQY